MQYTAKDLDPGIHIYKRNRRILSRTQLRNEIMLFRENSKKDSITMTLLSTDTAPTPETDWRKIEDKHVASGFERLEFHFFIAENGNVYTGLELHEDSELKADTLIIGLAGGRNSVGGIPKTNTLSVYTEKQIKSLMNLMGMFIIMFEKASMSTINVPDHDGMGPARVNAAELFKRVNERFVG